MKEAHRTIRERKMSPIDFPSEKTTQPELYVLPPYQGPCNSEFTDGLHLHSYGKTAICARVGHFGDVELLRLFTYPLVSEPDKPTGSPNYTWAGLLCCLLLVTILG